MRSAIPLRSRRKHAVLWASLLWSMWWVASTGALAADRASGSVAFKTYSSPIKYGWLVRGPDEMDASKTVLRMYLSSSDVGDKIKACRTLACADDALDDGAMIDYGDARHLAYAIRLNGELVQYSGGTNAQAFTLSSNEPNRLAGKVHIDDDAVGGGKIDAEFDLTLTRTFSIVR
jgi:hypothetical protein